MTIQSIPLKRCFRGENCKHPNGPYLPRSEFASCKNQPDHLMLECNYCRRKPGSRDRAKEESLRLRAMKRAVECAGQYPSGDVVHRQQHRARKANTAYRFNLSDWRECLQYFEHRCAYCGKQPKPLEILHHEHYVPVVKGGGYTSDNIIPACLECNSSKGIQDAHEWLLTRFGENGLIIEQRILNYFRYRLLGEG